MRISSGGSRVIRHAWTVAAILYGCLRVLAVAKFLSRYGVNIPVFAVIELFSSLLLGWSSGRLVENLLRAESRRRAPLIAATSVGYSAPDLYLFVWARSYPGHVIAALTGIVTVLLVVSLAVFISRLHVARTSSDIGHL